MYNSLKWDYEDKTTHKKLYIWTQILRYFKYFEHPKPIIGLTLASKSFDYIQAFIWACHLSCMFNCSSIIALLGIRFVLFGQLFILLGLLFVFQGIS